jgi:hypothetical protein
MDPLSLSFGVGFTAAGLALLTTELGLSDLHPRSWWPIPVLFLGGWLLLAALSRTRERDDRSLRDDAEASVDGEGVAADEAHHHSFDDDAADDADETEPLGGAGETEPVVGADETESLGGAEGTEPIGGADEPPHRPTA